MQWSDSKKRALAKRIADVLEKMSVGSLAVGIFQNNTLGVVIGLVCLALSLGITYRES